jgi:hypothetical protein
MEVDNADTAVVFIDPQNDVLDVRFVPLADINS